MHTFKLASAQYDIGFFEHWDEFAKKLDDWVSRAARQGARLLVFPEYGSMELTSLFGEAVYSDLAKQLHAMQSLLPRWFALHKSLAAQYDMHILASSFPTAQEDGSFVNRANLFGPEGLLG